MVKALQRRLRSADVAFASMSPRHAEVRRRERATDRRTLTRRRCRRRAAAVAAQALSPELQSADDPSLLLLRRVRHGGAVQAQLFTGEFRADRVGAALQAALDGQAAVDMRTVQWASR